jgi:hypothetical protein
MACVDGTPDDDAAAQRAMRRWRSRRRVSPPLAAAGHDAAWLAVATHPIRAPSDDVSSSIESRVQVSSSGVKVS